MEQASKRFKTENDVQRLYKDSFLEDPWAKNEVNHHNEAKTVFFKESFLEDPWSTNNDDKPQQYFHKERSKNFKPPCKHRKNCNNHSAQHRNQFYHPR